MVNNKRLPLRRLAVGASLVSLGLGSIVVAPTALAQTTTQLASVRAAHHMGYDRAVFEFKGQVPERHDAGYVTSVTADPSGKPVAVEGRYYLELHMFRATAVGSSVSARITTHLPNLVQVVLIGDFEGVLSYALGLNERVPVNVFTRRSPSRVVVDIPVLTEPVLGIGSRGADVRAAQYMLRAHGYQLVPDGIYGSRTDAAVRAFQRSHHLSVDGTIGHQTWTALESRLAYWARGDMVRALQVELNKYGMNLAVDAVYGPRTRAAVTHLERENWLPVTAAVDPMFWMTVVSSGHPLRKT